MEIARLAAEVQAGLLGIRARLDLREEEGVTGEELYAQYGESVLGPWDGQPADVQRAWEDIAAGVTSMLAAREAASRNGIQWCPTCGLPTQHPERPCLGLGPGQAD